MDYTPEPSSFSQMSGTTRIELVEFELK